MFKKFFSWIRSHTVTENPVNEATEIQGQPTTWEGGEQKVLSDTISAASGGGDVRILIANLVQIFKGGWLTVLNKGKPVAFFLGEIGMVVTGTQAKKQEVADQQKRIADEQSVDGLNVFVGAAVVVGVIMLVRKIFQ